VIVILAAVGLQAFLNFSSWGRSIKEAIPNGPAVPQWLAMTLGIGLGLPMLFWPWKQNNIVSPSILRFAGAALITAVLITFFSQYFLPENFDDQFQFSAF
jgi:formate-dependent nitrite reductase membrane component NrfD